MTAELPNEMKLELFEQLTETSPHDLIWVFTPEWDELVYLNGEYERLWGRSRTTFEANPRDFLNAVHPDDRDTLTAAMERVSAGEPAEVEYRITGDWQSPRWMHSTGEPIRDDAGEVRWVAGFTRDITVQKEQQRRLQGQNDLLDEFATVVAHDLRNPLNVAQGRLELAREEFSSEHLSTAASGIDRSLRLIDDLLTLARNGDRVDDVEAVELAEIVDGCWRNVQTGDASLVVETEQTLVADPSRLAQLIENLVRNAVEHGDGAVTVTVGDLEDGFYVADDGPGIPTDDSQRVFEDGYSTRRDGTGFGLKIVREISDAHGWDVHLRQCESGGARFEITGVATAPGDG